MSGRVSPAAAGNGGGSGAASASPAAAAEHDFLGIGEQCARPDCRALDFLPFRCDACRKAFCLEHRSYAAHACAAAAPGRELLVIVCPLCSVSVPLKPGEAPDAAFDRHARASAAAGGCDPRNYAAARARRVCGAPRCKEKLTAINTYECRACGRAVCMRHRHADDHACRVGGASSGGGGGGSGRGGARLGPSSSAAAAAGNGNGGNSGGGLLKQLWGVAAAAAASAVVPPSAEQQRQRRQEQRQQQQQQQQQQLDSYRQQQQQRYNQQQQQQRQQQQRVPGAGAAPAHEFACHCCGAGFDDPVALVEHDAACGGGGRGGAGGRGSDRPCTMS